MRVFASSETPPTKKIHPSPVPNADVERANQSHTSQPRPSTQPSVESTCATAVSAVRALQPPLKPSRPTPPWYTQPIPQQPVTQPEARHLQSPLPLSSVGEGRVRVFASTAASSTENSPPRSRPRSRQPVKDLETDSNVRPTRREFLGNGGPDIPVRALRRNSSTRSQRSPRRLPMPQPDVPEPAATHGIAASRVREAEVTRQLTLMDLKQGRDVSLATLDRCCAAIRREAGPSHKSCRIFQH